EKIIQDLVKRITFEKKYIKNKLTNKKRKILAAGGTVAFRTASYTSYIESLISGLYFVLMLRTFPVDTIFRYKGRTFEDYEKCREVPDEPLRKDYFPEEPRSSLLSKVLASVISVGNLDRVGSDSNAYRLKKIRRS
ncbi:uncharacterized protein N7458_005862, partial [Penicillium daleae]